MQEFVTFQKEQKVACTVFMEVCLSGLSVITRKLSLSTESNKTGASQLYYSLRLFQITNLCTSTSTRHCDLCIILTRAQSPVKGICISLHLPTSGWPPKLRGLRPVEDYNPLIQNFLFMIVSKVTLHVHMFVINNLVIALRCL